MASKISNLGFVHLRVHSAYSLLEGALPIAKLVELAKADKMPALALTDTNNLFGALEFSEALAKSGIQPIIGCTLAIDLCEGETNDPIYDAARMGDGPKAGINGLIALLAKDKAGYENLMWLASQAFLVHSDQGQTHIKLDELKDRNEGLILLSGGPSGPINRALIEDGETLARTRLGELKAAFSDRFYVELQRHGRTEERDIERQLIEIAYDMKLPLVATNEPYFPTRDDYEAHDALICIAEGSYVSEDDRRRLTPEHHFKSREEMMALFSDLSEALENTIEIAKRCAYRPLTRGPILPQSVKVAKGQKAEEIEKAEAKELKRQATSGLKERLAAHGCAPGYNKKDYETRLAYELDVITGMKFPGYFLIVSDFIKWTKAQGIPVGPGRGSGAGSVVAWSLTITDLDPMRFGLLFERFLNPERVSMPDFDIDFCQDRRDEVIRYVQKKYGTDRVAQIITFGKLQARAVLRDVGRVLSMPYGQVDKLCKMVPNNPANPVTLAEAINGEPKLQEARDSEPIVARLLDIGQRLEGLYRHASTHAAGVVISDRPLTELVPLYRDPRSDLAATQFNMKWVEPAGLVKFDFLGLKTLTVIEKAVQLIAGQGVEIDMAALPLDDSKTYELMARGDTIGVFQLEGSGMRESLRKLKPDRFEDIIAMVALYRPGPMDNIETYINRKYGLEEPDYLHALIEPILKETYGVIIYQEQVMQVAQQLSGYSLGEADLLRRAMGKKIKAEMDKQKTRFIEGAIENDVEKAQAEYIFELVAKFAGYGFNKSHAAAYALLAYQTAYLKANYPVEFMAAIMTLDQGNTDKINLFYQEGQKLGIEMKPPCVNASRQEFLPEDGGIRYSLAALKNIGQQAVEHICEEREKTGGFASLSEFAQRINPRMLNKRALETLAAAGAFDVLEPDRAAVYGNIDKLLGEANRSSEDRAHGQSDLFGNGGKPPPMELRRTEPWLPMEKLTREFDAVGFFLSGHPLDEYEAALTRLGVEHWVDFENEVRSGRTAGVLAGTVTYRQERKSKSGNRFAFAGFSDQTGQFEAVIFSDTLAVSRELLEPGTPVFLRVEAELDGDNVKTRVQSIDSLDHAAQGVQKGLCLRVDSSARLQEIAGKIEEKGAGEIRLLATLDDLDREVEFTLPGRFNVSPRQASLFRTLSGVISVYEI